MPGQRLDSGQSFGNACRGALALWGSSETGKVLWEASFGHFPVNTHLNLVSSKFVNKATKQDSDSPLHPVTDPELLIPCLWLAMSPVGAVSTSHFPNQRLKAQPDLGQRTAPLPPGLHVGCSQHCKLSKGKPGLSSRGWLWFATAHHPGT